MPNRPSVDSFSYVFGPIFDSSKSFRKSLSCSSGIATVKGVGVDFLLAGRVAKVVDISMDRWLLLSLTIVLKLLGLCYVVVVEELLRRLLNELNGL